MKKRTWFAALAAVMIMYTGCQSDSDDPENDKKPTERATIADVSASAGSGMVRLSWKNPSDADFYGTEITFTPAADGIKQPIIVTGTSSADSSYIVQGLANGTTYTFSLAALYKSQPSSAESTPESSGQIDISDTPTNTPDDTTPPAAVMGLSAESLSETVRLTWTDPADTDLFGIEIAWKKTAEDVGAKSIAPMGTGTIFVAPGTQYAQIPELDGGTEYTFTVTAMDTSGNRSNEVKTRGTPINPNTSTGTETPGDTGTSIKAEYLNFGGLTASDFGLESFEPNELGLQQNMAKNDTIITHGNLSAVLHTDYIYSTGLRVRNAYGRSIAVNYQGHEYGDMSTGTVDFESEEIQGQHRYISVPLSCTGTLTIKYDGKNRKTDFLGENKLQIGFAKTDGTVLEWQKVPAIETDGVAASGELSAHIPEGVDTVRIVFSTNGSKKNEVYTEGSHIGEYKRTGSLDIYSILFTPDSSETVTLPFLIKDGSRIVSCDKNKCPETLVLPADTTEIAEKCFESCTNLTSVIIPEGVTEIGNHTFKDCTSLRAVTLPASLKKIANGTNSAFSNCTQLTVNYNGTLEQWTTMDNDRTLMENATSIILSDERNLRDITTLTIPGTIAKIGSNAFHKCTNLTSVTISDSVETIEYSAFRDCALLTSITLPANIMEIRDYTFYGCTALTTITIPDNVKSIGSTAFYKCTNLTSVNIPDGVTRIEESTFRECKMLEHVELPNSVTFIGRRAFRRCYALKEMKLPDGVTEIVDDAFYECTSLTRIDIPDSVTSVGTGIFKNCTKLTDIYYAGTQEQWKAISETADVPSTATIHCSDGDITPDYGTGGEDTSSGSKDETTDSAGSESTPSTEDSQESVVK